MEGGSGVAEAERWLTIAAKLLAARDLHGARTFAIRARESDPRYEGSSQVLAVSDTLLAGDSLVNNHPDWYSVLQLARFTHDPDLIAAQYRKLALLLNPVRTRLAFADQALKLVYEAWSVLSNPPTKLLYDNELHLSQLGQLGQLGQPSPNQEPLEPPPNQQPLPLTPNQQRQPQTPNQLWPPQPQPLNQQRQPQTPTQNQQRQPTTPVRRSPRTKDGTSMVEEEEGPSLNESTRPDPEIHAPEPEPRTRRAPDPEPRPNRAADAEKRPNRATQIKKPPIPVAEPEPESEQPSFWTACPYCYHLYEYPKVYEECTVRCQHCRRAFHAAMIPSPPLADGKNSYFCSWGFFPLGSSGNAKSTTNWSPISGMFACPLQADGKPATNQTFPEAKKSRGRPRKNPTAPPRQQYYHDDSDGLIDLSDLSDDSDDGEWKHDNSRRKKANNGKGKGPVGRPPKKGVVVTPGQLVVVHALSAGPKKHPVASSGKKQSAKAAKDLGKLDLNVEFSNDVEEQGRSEGNGARSREEDNMEGIGFFEGLDEFLSSLPILNVVGDDKVKPS